LLLKRIFDFLASFLGLVLLSPVFFIIAVLVRIRMKGPVFYRQQRVGQYGKLFWLYKFRTMTNDHNGSSVSVLGEERITPFGAALRRHKLDDLPQLWNVFTGDMSFVGPRPDVPGYADQLKGEDRWILDLKPGITGPATLKYAYEEELLSRQSDPQRYNDEVIWPDKVRINVEYVQERSFWGDMGWIWRTVRGI
jgi:lipopolysaccharide/colanic/teichoic acid biosynthesis glycosyltransferase